MRACLPRRRSGRPPSGCARSSNSSHLLLVHQVLRGTVFLAQSAPWPLRRPQLRQHRHNDVVVATLDGAIGFLFRDQNLMHLLARTNSGNFDFDFLSCSPISACAMSVTRAEARAECMFHHARLLDRRENGVDRLLEAEEEAGHVSRGNGHRPAAANLLMEEWNDRSPRGQHVAIAHTDEACVGASRLARMNRRS